MRLCIYILLTFLSTKAFSQGNVWIKSVPPPDTLLPGKYFTMVYSVFVQDENVDSIRTEMILQEGWKALSTRTLIAEDRNSAKVFYTIGLKDDVRAGYYPVRFNVFINNKLRGFRKEDARVREIRKIVIEPLNVPDFIIEGQTLVIEYLVSNHGNRRENLNFETENASFEAPSTSLNLKPGETLKIKVKQTVADTDQRSWFLTSKLLVFAKGLTEPFRNFVNVPVYSSKRMKVDRYRKFPLEAGVSFMHHRIGDRSLSGYQYFVKGAGELDSKGNHIFDFKIRGPNQFLFPIMGSYDQYSFGYNYRKNLYVSLGDYYLSFNNLMELGRFGRGAYAEAKLGKYEMKLFYQNARFFPFQKSSQGGSVTYSPNSNLKLSVSQFSKETFANKQWLNTHMLGFGLKFQNRAFATETEIAANKAFGKYDFGFFNRANAHFGRLSIDNNVVYAGKNFLGFYSNSRMFIGNANFYLNRKFSTGLNYNYILVNPNFDATVFQLSPFTTTLAGYLSYLPNKKHRLYLNYSVGDRRDRQEIATYDFNESFVNISHSRDDKNIRFFSQARIGSTRNNLLPDVDNSRKVFSTFLVQPSFRLFNVWLGGYFERQHTSRFSELDQSQTYYYYGGNLFFNYKKEVSLSVNYRNSYAPDEMYISRSFLDTQLSIDVKQHRFVVSGGQVFLPNPEVKGQNSFFFKVSYSFRLGVPISKKKNLGKFSGRITGMTPDIRRDGMLVKIGDREVLTDHTGEFSFDNLVADKYVLTLSQTHKDMGLVSKIKFPLEVVVQADSSGFLEIPFSKTGSIVGKIEFGSSILNEEFPAVILKLYNEETYLVTDLKKDKSFSFKEVLPGHWKLKASIAGAGKDYIVDMEERSIIIEASKAMNVIFSIRKNDKKVQFSSQSFDIKLNE